MAKLTQPEKHYVVVCEVGSIPVCTEMDSEAVQPFLEGLVGDDVNVFIFKGQRAGISEGDHKYLTWPGEAPVALFKLAAPGDLAIDPTGYMGILNYSDDEEEEEEEEEEEAVVKAEEADEDSGTDDDDEFDEFDLDDEV